MTRTSPTTTGCKRNGFTFIEILIVTAIIGIMAVMVMPRYFFPLVTPLRSMQRAVTEITDMALGGHTVRLRMEPLERSDRGRLIAEVLTRTDGHFDQFALSWEPADITHLPESEDWRLEPEIIYFHSDGTNTPARIMRADGNTRITEGDFAMLTITGFLFEPVD